MGNSDRPKTLAEEMQSLHDAWIELVRAFLYEGHPSLHDVLMKVSRFLEKWGL